MAESDFNFGPNYPPGGAPENPRVNNAAFDAEAKKAQQLQTETIKSLTETVQKLTKQYEELTDSSKKLTEDELAASKMLRDKISALSQILSNIKAEAATGVAPSPLSNIGIKERTETFDRLTAVIKDYQRSAAELKGSNSEIDFDSWIEGYIEQQKLDQLTLQEQKYNTEIISDIKSILKDSNTSLSSLSEDELETLAKRSIQLSIDQKQRELQVIQQNKDVIKLNKDANALEIKNTKELIESRKFDPTKFVVEKGFKVVGKDLEKIIENTKPRSLVKIILDLLGPFGAVIGFFIKTVVNPLVFTFGLLAAFFDFQFIKFKRIGELFTGELFTTMIKYLILVRDTLKFVFKDMPSMIAAFVNNWSRTGARFFWQLSKVGNFFMFITSQIEYFGMVLASFFKPLSSVGKSIGSTATAISSFASRVLAPITEFFSTGVGKIILILDRFGFGLGTVFRLGSTVGSLLAGALGPLASLFTFISDIPLFFSKLFSGNIYTMIKAIMATIVQVAGLILSTIFGGPIGAVVAGMMLKLENILKWFDPIFDFLIYAGALVFGLLMSIYKDFVEPVIQTIGKVLMVVFNVAFALLKPVFKLGQFILILLAPLFVIIGAVFKGLGYVFKAIGWLADALNMYVIDPFVKFMEDFLFKFIQPIYDYIADSFIGKMLGMETKTEREKRQAEERDAAIKAKQREKQKEEKPASEGFSFTMPSIPSGMGGMAERGGAMVTETVDKGTALVKAAITKLDLTMGGFGDMIKEFIASLKGAVYPLTAALVQFARSMGANATQFGMAAIDKLNTPEARNAFGAATSPMTYSTASTIKPAYTTASESQIRGDMQAFVEAMKSNMKPHEYLPQPTVNNQQTNINTTNTSGSLFTTPSQSERTINQINSSLRPAG